MDAPFITGSDLIANPGNAALGYSSGVGYNVTPEQNPFAGIQSSLTSLQNEDVYRRQQAALQAQKEKDELASHLAETGQSVFNMKGENGQNMSFNRLPGDVDVLNRRANEINKQAIGNSLGWKWDTDRIAKENELKELTREAGVRSVEYAKLQQAAAATQDPEERAALLNHAAKLQSQKLEDRAAIEPYMPRPAYSLDKTGVAADVLSGKDKNALDDINLGVETDAQGNQTQYVKPGIRASLLSSVISKSVPGTPEYVNNSNMLRAYYSNPAYMAPQAVMQTNANIDRYNQDRGLKAGDPEFAEHMADVLPNGQVIPKPLNPNNVGKLTYSLLAEHAGQLGRDVKLKKTANEVAKENVDIKSKKADIAKTYADIENDKEKLRQSRESMTKADYDNQNEVLQAKTAAANVYSNINSVSPDKFMSIQDAIKDISYTNPNDENTTKKGTIYTGKDSDMYQALKNDGVYSDDYTIALLNKNDQTVKHIGGVQLQKQDGTLSSGVETPKFTYLLKPKDGAVSGYKYLVGYNQLEEATNPETGTVIIDGKTNKPKMREVMKWKTVSPQEAIGNSVKAAKNFYNITDKTGDNINRAVDYFGKLTGGEQPSVPENTAPTAPTVQGNKPSGVSSPERPASVPSTAFLNAAGYWVDAKNKKLYNSAGDIVKRN